MIMLAVALAMAWQTGYITEHPIDQALAIVNTKDGQFQVRPEGNCLGIDYEKKFVLLTGEQPTYYVEKRLACALIIEKRLSDEPCFQTDGECDPSGD